MQTFKVVRTGRITDVGVRYTSPTTVYNALKSQMNRLDREQFTVIHLDAKNHLLAREVISVGSLTQAIVHPREVFKGAVLNGSCAVILMHNHPSGDPAPSSEDHAITHRLRLTGSILGIEVLDHIIFGSERYYSFVEAEETERLTKLLVQQEKKRLKKEARGNIKEATA